MTTYSNRGGSFLVQGTTPDEVFTPEDFTADQLSFAKTARDFVEKEVVPASRRIEATELEVTLGLMRKAGELGLLMADVPEEFGGLGLDKTSCALIAESLSGQGSFHDFCLAHTGIGTLPIVYYGTPEQKAKYLPGLADGSVIGCYCLTEPTAGSDALSIRTRAVLSADGSHYVLNGTKQFITNARSAGVFIVFAKVDGEHFTGFVVERGTPGLSIGRDEGKMGIHGTTTNTVTFDDAPVPAANVLGEVGQGHKIAFNILNIGRFKLGAGAVGMCKRAIDHTVRYALERKQFGRRLVDFGAIREKLAHMGVLTYAAEAACYRTVGRIDALLGSTGDDHGEASLQSIEEYGIECAMVKILGTEAFDRVADEMVQCYGGYGYSADYPAELYYRDSRINRLFEGTNEINRIVVATQLLRRWVTGELPLASAAQAAAARVSGAQEAPAGAGLLAAERRAVESLKTCCLLVMGLLVQKSGKAAAANQPILFRLADLVLHAYAAESALLRASKDVARRGAEAASFPVALATVACEEALEQGLSLARQAAIALERGEALEALLAGLEGLGRRRPVDTVGLLERVAVRMVEMERWVV